MTVVYQSDLAKASSASFLSSLDQDITDATKLKQSIDNFIANSNTGSNQLSGASWDAVRNKLNKYNSILDKRIQLASTIKEAILNSCNSLNSYMEDYTKLDTSELSDLQTRLGNAKNTLANLRASLDTIYSHGDGDVPDVSGILSDISFYQNTLIPQLERHIEKLEDLPDADASSLSMIESAIGELSSFSADVNGIEVSSVAPTV